MFADGNLGCGFFLKANYILYHETGLLQAQAHIFFIYCIWLPFSFTPVPVDVISK
jgi:hypothetical protein